MSAKSTKRICTPCAQSFCAEDGVPFSQDRAGQMRCPICRRGSQITKCRECGEEHCRHNPTFNHFLTRKKRKKIRA